MEFSWVLGLRNAWEYHDGVEGPFGSFSHASPYITTMRADTEKWERAILHLVEILLGKRVFSLPHVFSEFSDKHPFLAKIGYSVIIVALWAALFPISSVLPRVFSQVLWIAILLELGFIVAAIILSVGFFDLIQKDWDFMQIGIGFIIAILVVSFTYILLLYAVGLLEGIS